MPLRDHFRRPLDSIASWEGFHGGWPMVIVQQLRKQLPAGYVAEPRVHSGSQEVEYAVRVFDAKRGRQLVAAIEIVSPANKDRAEHRNAFVGKCAALLQKGGRRQHRRSRDRAAFQPLRRGAGFRGPQRPDARGPTARPLCHIVSLGQEVETNDA